MSAQTPENSINFGSEQHQDFSSEIDLIAQAGKDNEAFAQLYERHFGRILRIANSIIKNPEDAEDAAMLAIEKIWGILKQGGYTEKGTFGSWANVVARTTAISAQRRKRYEVSLDILSPRGQKDSIQRTIEQEEEARYLQLAIGQIPRAEHQHALLLRFYEDLPFEQVGEVLGVPSATARTWVDRGIKRLRQIVPDSERP